MKKILFISNWFPFPPTNGSELRIDALLRGLAARYEVTLLSFQRRTASAAALAEANAICHGVQLVPWREFEPGSARSIAGYFSARPRSVAETYSPTMAQKVREKAASGEFDLIVCSQLKMAEYAREFGAVPAVLEEVELGVFAQQAVNNDPKLERVRRKLMWAKRQAYVRRLLPRFAACTVVSTKEKELLRQVAPEYEPIEVIPNGINLPAYENVTAHERENSLIFTGAFTYSVNHQAMVWFMNEIYPRIRRRVPELNITVTGDNAGLSLPNDSEVTFTGYLDDIKPLVAGTSISIVPLLQGGGTRLKILESMALCTPVISTSKGAEGLLANGGEHLLIADDPETFADAVIMLLQDANLRERIAGNARQLVERYYSWQSIIPQFVEVVERTRSVSGQPA